MRAPLGTPRPRVVALGGGHGLAGSLAALRRLDVELTAVVTVADNGGSSGRIRREFPVVPPGDLRMALASLAGDDDWGSRWAALLQHRFGGSGALAGHPVGNLILTGLAEMTGDMVSALDLTASLLGAVGRVLPMSPTPLEIEAQVGGIDDDPRSVRTIRGQVAVASTPGRVLSVALHPTDPPACPEAVAAIDAADLVVFGPGSWFTSVLPHLMVPELAAALVRTRARRVVVLNLAPQAGETDDFGPENYLHVLCGHAPQLRIDTVIADSGVVDDATELTEAAQRLGAGLVIAPVAMTDGSARHDPTRLARAFGQLVAPDR